MSLLHYLARIRKTTVIQEMDAGSVGIGGSGDTAMQGDSVYAPGDARRPTSIGGNTPWRRTRKNVKMVVPQVARRTRKR